MSEPARTYNQTHVPRPPTPGRRRASIYIAWSYPAEANRNITELDNRFSTMTEVRRVLWPAYEVPRFADPLQFQQGVAGALELFFWAWVPFQKLVCEVTGHAVPVFQRVDQAGFVQPLDERVLDDVDTLFLFGLDHNVSGQMPADAEIEAVRAWLRREGTRLVIGPHHDVGATDDMEQRAMEYAHHGDLLVPRQQRFGAYALALLHALGIPVENRYAMRPAVREGTRDKIVPLNAFRDVDTKGILAGVESLNFHMHLPHYALTRDDGTARVLAKQAIDLSRPHPMTLSGETEFNTLVWAPPAGDRAGDVVVCDSTVFSTLFGADESLERFWKNLVS
ncbi:hypothetical protein [Phenylobacterium sp.]|uniref:hypothetical protein n=1 Tax=Phenylobacterium sp. TaxID=1871053 RepID=UPI002731A2AA|nr:hypothetical protein [Phenylobacterium sp.]MDP1600553.1 hypothetical protein [Phenylobacterium sp.]MDP3591227.1 hypothetical protein [Phenylobacterium sp.]